MTLKEKKEKLRKVYERFETDVHEFKKDAICKIGCTYCCTDAGNVDIITLEGIIIQERVNGFPQSLKREVKRGIAQNRLDKERGKVARCPFLKEDDTCLIYDIRPFSCRRLYSLKECRGRGPTVHREVVEFAGEAVREMQRLDSTGYSGHVSFILYLLDRPSFRKLYLAGGFDPGKIAKFGKTHRLVINRFAT